MNKKSVSARSAKGGTTQSSSKNTDWITNNWSGYARKDQPGTFWEVFGAWTVPVILPNPPSNTAKISTWVGIDGFFADVSLGLIQIGTGAEYVNNTPSYYAWYEVLPENRFEVRLDPSLFPVDALDSFFGEVRKEDDFWSVSLLNLTKNWSFTQLVNYNGAQQSAEFIVERPSNSRVCGGTCSLAPFSLVTFDHCFINDYYPNFITDERGFMFDYSSGQFIASPSIPDDDGDGFSVAFGPTPPSPPPSSSPSDGRIVKQMFTMLNHHLQGGKNSLQKMRNSIIGGAKRLANSRSRKKQCTVQSNHRSPKQGTKGSMVSSRIGKSTLSIPSKLMNKKGNR